MDGDVDTLTFQGLAFLTFLLSCFVLCFILGGLEEMGNRCRFSSTILVRA